MPALFTSGQRERLLKVEGVTAVGGTRNRVVYVDKDTPQIHAEIAKAVGSNRYKVLERKPPEAPDGNQSPAS